MQRHLKAIALIWALFFASFFIPSCAHARDIVVKQERDGTLTFNGKSYVINNNTDTSSTSEKEVGNPSVYMKYVEEAGLIGKALGSGVASSAKELGVAVNEFAQTPVGKLTAGLVIYKVFGRDVIHLVAAFICVFLGTGFSIYLLRFYLKDPAAEETFVYVPVLWGAFSVKKVSSRKAGREDKPKAAAILSAISLLVGVALFLLVMP